MKATAILDEITTPSKDNLLPFMNHIIEIKEDNENPVKSTHCHFRVEGNLQTFTDPKIAQYVCDNINNGNIIYYDLSKYVFGNIINAYSRTLK